eukprot:4148855-Amphidinium_carterae.3
MQEVLRTRAAFSATWKCCPALLEHTARCENMTSGEYCSQLQLLFWGGTPENQLLQDAFSLQVRVLYGDKADEAPHDDRCCLRLQHQHFTLHSLSKGSSWRVLATIIRRREAQIEAAAQRFASRRSRPQTSVQDCVSEPAVTPSTPSSRHSARGGYLPPCYGHYTNCPQELNTPYTPRPVPNVRPLFFVPEMTVTDWAHELAELMLSFATLLGELIAQPVYPEAADGGVTYLAQDQTHRTTGVTFLSATPDRRLRVAIFDLLVRAAHALDLVLLHLALSDDAKLQEDAAHLLYPLVPFHTGWFTRITCRYAVVIDRHVGDVYVLFKRNEAQGLLRGGYSPRSRELIYRFFPQMIDMLEQQEREMEEDAQRALAQMTPPHSQRILTIPFPRDPEWEPPHAAAVQTAAEILMQLTSRRLTILREQAGVVFYDTGPPFQAAAVTTWHLPADHRVREVLMYALTRGARALRLSMATFNLRRQQIRRGAATRVSDFNTSWMTTCNGAYAVILTAALDDLVVFYREPLHLALRGGSLLAAADNPSYLNGKPAQFTLFEKESYTPRKWQEQRASMHAPELLRQVLQKCAMFLDSACPTHARCTYFATRTTFLHKAVATGWSGCNKKFAWVSPCCQCFFQLGMWTTDYTDRLASSGICPIGNDATLSPHLTPQEWLDKRSDAQHRRNLPSQKVHPIGHLIDMFCRCPLAVILYCLPCVAHVGSNIGANISPWRGGVTDLDVDFAAEEAPPPEDPADAVIKVDDATEPAATMQKDEPEPIDSLPVQDVKLTTERDGHAPAAPSPAETTPAVVLPAAKVEEQYDPVRRAKILAGRLHLGMELDDRRVLPPGDATKTFTVLWGEVVGGVRKETEALWQSIANFNATQELLWHGCWHLDFIPKDQAADEAYNLNKALWKQGHDWDHTQETISRCRAKMRHLTDMLNPAWQDLKTQIAKNKPKQRAAWDAILKAAALPTREDYEKKANQKLQQIRQKEAGQPAQSGSSNDHLKVAAKPVQPEPKKAASRAERPS